MNITIFILCYNEEILLPHTIYHYKKYLPSSTINIYDNESTDNSVEIAKSLGLKVISFNTDNKLDEYKQTHIKNTCWQDIDNGWIIVVDMDEWLCVTEDELQYELEKGTSILKIKGVEMIGESETEDLSDINLHTIDTYVYNKMESKNLCFLRNKICEIQYIFGAHKCRPISNDNCDIIYSEREYINKHMSYLGLPFIIKKTLNRYNRSEEMRLENKAIQYTNNIDIIKNRYNKRYNERHTNLLATKL